MSFTHNSTLAVGLGALALVGLATRPAAAAIELLSNGDFNSPTAPAQTTPPGTAYSMDDITNWSFSPQPAPETYSYGVAAINTPSPLPAGDVYSVAYSSSTVPAGGTQVAYINPPGGIIYQTVSLTANTSYVGSVYFGNRSDFSPGPTANEGTLELFSATPGSGNQAPLGLALESVDLTSALGTFTQYSFTYTPTVTGTYDFALGQVSGQPNFADASLSPAPEPSQVGTLSLMGLSLGGLLRRARRRVTTAPAS